MQSDKDGGTLMNVVLFPKENDAGKTNIPYGSSSRLYLNGIYMCRFKEEHGNYTITWDAFSDLVNGLQMALSGLKREDILFDEARLAEVFGEDLSSIVDKGLLWAKVEEYLGLQVVG